ncbi:hypothetical protein E2C01_075196 [Portunus trituberculatus]|uniref:Uncharacterized protein n=1 Tax=Portunus trituberculatus TaxID=210409 RepID=A0A5B7IEE1_PORTR|nr:hypothetical protein [Portunus trituberculatus]
MRGSVLRGIAIVSLTHSAFVSPTPPGWEGDRHRQETRRRRRWRQKRVGRGQGDVEAVCEGEERVRVGRGEKREKKEKCCVKYDWESDML